MSDIIKNEAEQGSGHQAPICSEPLTKQELDRLFWRYQLGYLDLLQPRELARQLLCLRHGPPLQEVLDKDGQREGMLRMFDFINTEQTTASVLWGILVGMEEQKALGKPVNDEMIRTVKSSLMGPLAGVGDSLVQATILPLLTTIAISLTGAGDVLQLRLAPYSSSSRPRFCCGPMRVSSSTTATPSGKDAVSTLMGTAMDRIKTAVQLFGIIVIGALSASYVKLSTPLSFAASADATPVVLQDVINGIFPNVLSLLLVIGCWYLLSKKGMSVTKVIFGLMGIVVSARPHRNSLVERTTSGDKQSLRISRRAPVQVLRVGRP